ncbi:hypothetical protein [Desulfotignum phosphitoxidans]|uniref:Uncharacterized protein n=1 Tax=Desulfotignum phosphitoxidans DSM 13687 TaxID=1286635 RepID=S0FTJ4_9BACT|nr:hypothetical protein [Desulfotignum phosphitoxidans]EMS78413.1 hypothetical protein Dpo_8c00800 [Desulfotignum phosphitoxidans DSM 13687]
MADKVSKEQVYAMLGKRLAGELKEHTGHIDGVYWPSWDKDEKVWVAHPPGNHDCIGASRTIVISQKTGEVLADRMVGE